MKLNLDLKGVAAETGGLADLLPDGVYVMQVVAAEPKETKNNTGYFIEVVFRVAQGPEAGKQFVERLNVQNSNPDAQRISLARLKGILEKGGHPNPDALRDTDELLKLRPMSVTLVQEKSVSGDKEYINNRAKKYAAYDPAAVPPVIPPTAPHAAAAPVVVAAPGPGPQVAPGPQAATATPPWMR